VYGPAHKSMDLELIELSKGTMVAGSLKTRVGAMRQNHRLASIGALAGSHIVLKRFRVAQYRSVAKIPYSPRLLRILFGNVLVQLAQVDLDLAW
jgi:hypothetical protein